MRRNQIVVSRSLCTKKGILKVSIPEQYTSGRALYEQAKNDEAMLFPAWAAIRGFPGARKQQSKP